MLERSEQDLKNSMLNLKATRQKFLDQNIQMAGITVNHLQAMAKGEHLIPSRDEMNIYQLLYTGKAMRPDYMESIYKDSNMSWPDFTLAVLTDVLTEALALEGIFLREVMLVLRILQRRGE